MHFFFFSSARRTSKAQQGVAKVKKFYFPSNSNESHRNNNNNNNNNIVHGWQTISKKLKVVTLPLPTPLLRWSATWMRVGTLSSFTNIKCLITVYTKFLRQITNTIRREVEKNCSEACCHVRF
jgi:hypothetical protein